MQCMKCGRDVEAGEVFCAFCQEEMQKYPVKPGTVVQLPYRPQQTASKKQAPRRRVSLPAEEQLKLLKRMTRGMAIALVLAILATVGLAYTAVTLYLEYHTKPLPGQNYSAASTTTPTTEATEPSAASTDAGIAG